MRIKITRPDGTVIEFDGTPEDARRAAGEAPLHVGPPHVQFVPLPCSRPHRDDFGRPWWGITPPPQEWFTISSSNTTKD
jgi:hypothetical protein